MLICATWNYIWREESVLITRIQITFCHSYFWLTLETIHGQKEIFLTINLVHYSKKCYNDHLCHIIWAELPGEYLSQNQELNSSSFQMTFILSDITLLQLWLLCLLFFICTNYISHTLNKLQVIGILARNSFSFLVLVVCSCCNWFVLLPWYLALMTAVIWKPLNYSWSFSALSAFRADMVDWIV